MSETKAPEAQRAEREFVDGVAKVCADGIAAMCAAIAAALPRAEDTRPQTCGKQINTGTGSTNCRLHDGHGGYCSEHPIAMRPRAEDTRPAADAVGERGEPVTTGDVIEAAYQLEKELREHVPAIPFASHSVRHVLEKHLSRAFLRASSLGELAPEGAEDTALREKLVWMTAMLDLRTKDLENTLEQLDQVKRERSKWQKKSIDAVNKLVIVGAELTELKRREAALRTQVGQVARLVGIKADAAAGIAARTKEPDSRNWAGLADELRDTVWTLDEIAAGREVAALTQGAKNRAALASPASPAPQEK